MSYDRALSIQKSVINTIDELHGRLTKTVTSDEDIHRTRVDIKHLRSWLRLLQIKTEDIDWKPMDYRLIKISKTLGGARDAHVINEILSMLELNAISKKERLAINRFKERLNINFVSNQVDWKTTQQILSHELITFKNNFVSFESMHTIKNGLRYTYKKTLQHGQKTYFKSKAADDLHKLRKWVKCLNYQLGYISKRDSDSCKQTIQSLHELGELLGKANDLNMIYKSLTLISDKEDNIKDFALINSLLNKHLKQILKNSKYLYESVFNLSPKKFIKKINV
ncbi:MAG: CHAD domain-containing protein [Gammaproteobacteria bacterium]|jgi:CHAD domain-containing protein